MGRRFRSTVCYTAKALIGGAAIAVLLATAGRAQDPAFLVKDINTAPDAYASSEPRDAVVAAGSVYFTAYDREHGRELWKTTGTPDSTVLVKDINPGHADGVKSPLVVVGGTVFFAADDGSHKAPWYPGALWKSDGTAEGTVPVADMFPDALTNVNGTLFFSAPSGVGDTQTGTVNAGIWKSDGTAAGTVLVKDFPVDVEDFGCYWKEIGPSLAAGAQRLFFISEGLWTSDGTEAGTVQLTTGCPDPNFVTVNGITFFIGAEESGAGLLRTDGTPEGTWRVKDIGFFYNDEGYTYSPLFTGVGQTLFFVGNDGTTGFELWKSDGTETGTVLVKDTVPGGAGLTACDLSDENDSGDCLPSMAAVNGTLFFSGIDLAHGRELWKSDGTADGTVLVRDIDPGADGSDPSQLTDAGGVLFFLAGDGGGGGQLWRSDGTPDGTTLVRRLLQGSFASIVAADGVAANGPLFVSADDGMTGREPWWSDGSEAGTVQLKDIFPGDGGSFPRDLTDVGGTLFFTADDGVHGRELWRSDASEDSTAIVKDIQPGAAGSSPTALTVANGILFFVADDGATGPELWRSNGTAAGTQLVKDINPGAPGSAPSHLTAVGDALLFFADDGVHGRKLWRTDGTDAGTQFVADVGLPLTQTVVGDTLFFITADGAAPGENDCGHAGLWRSDGTAGGTRLVRDMIPNFCFYGDQLTHVERVLIFIAGDGSVDGGGLWRSGGTEEGTTLVTSLPSAVDFGVFAGLDGELFFSEDYWSDDKRQLWGSDGTAAGTLPIVDLTGFVGNIVGAGGIFFFTEDYSWWDHKVWRTDGTPANTQPIYDASQYYYDAVDSLALSLVVKQQLLFTVSGERGPNFELALWASDGSEAGTVRLQDISAAADAPDANVEVEPFPPFTVSGSNVFFASAHGGFGRELWALPLSALPTIVSAEPSPTPSATATPTAAPVCIGDCENNLAVHVNDLITLVDIALGNKHVSDCASGLPPGISDQDVTVALIIEAVNHALNGCPV